MAFAAAKLVFVYQEQPGVWVFYGAADFVKLAKPSKVCFLSQIQDEEHGYLVFAPRVCAMRLVSGSPCPTTQISNGITRNPGSCS